MEERGECWYPRGMAKQYDATLKQILDDYSPDWVAWLSPGLGLPLGPLVALDPEISTVQVAADKVFRLPAGAGVLHLEVQSSWDGDLPDRMLEYNVYLHGRDGGPVHSVAILLRREANATAITGQLVRHRHDGRPFLTFEYAVVRVWELTAEQLLTGGLGTAPLGLLTDDAQEHLPALVRRLADRAASEIAEPQARDRFLAGSSILLGLRYDSGVAQALFAGVQGMEESSVYQMLVQRGVEKGRAEGRVEELHLTLRTLLEQKFGGIAPELESRVQQTADTDKLRAAIRQVLTIQSPADLVL